MPDDSFIRFEKHEEREKFLPILIEIYNYESTKVSGSTGGARRFSDCIWTKQEMFDAIKTKIDEQDDDLERKLDELILLMSDKKTRHMMRFKKKDGEYYHLTRLAELVRTTSSLHEYSNRDAITYDENDQPQITPRKFPIVDGIRWEPRLRYGASRKINCDELIQHIRSEFGSNHTLPTHMGGHHIDVAIADLTTVLEATEYVITKGAGGLKFSEFQKESIVKAFKNSWTMQSNSALVITAGTGMGKTLGFTVPVITDALLSNRANGLKCSQLLMYPRNDLAKDQFEQITKIIKRLNHSFATSGQSERCLGTALDADQRLKNYQDNFPTSGSTTVPWGIGSGNAYEAAASTYSGDKPASIIACSIESFRRRLRIPEVCAGLANGLRRIVLDEVHLSNGIQGGHHSRILSRCKQLLYPNPHNALTFIGVSATIAKPREHVSKIWYSSDERAKHVDHVDSETLDRTSAMGIRHNVMVRPRRGTSPIGTLVDMTSAVSHQRRSRDFYDRPKTGQGFDYEALQKTVGFADSHEIVGNWYSFMLDNESTSRANRLEDSTRKPYAHWHSNMLEFHEGGAAVCASCQNMQYAKNPITMKGKDIGKFKLFPDDTLDDCQQFSSPLPEHAPGCGDFEVYGLDTCPNLQAGMCWWFSPRTSTPEPRPGNRGYTSYRDVVRVKKHTGKTNSNRQETAAGEAKADYSFKEKSNYGAYPGSPSDEESPFIPHDIAIATPTLEVGVDMSNVSDVLTHKAIRNVSSYRQKVGRAGREPGTDALAMTLMSLRRQEFQYYRSMFRLVDAEILDPVPVANNNLAMKKNQAYEAIFDFLAKNNHDIEYIPGLYQPPKNSYNDSEWNNLDDKIRTAMNAICTFDSDGNPDGISHHCDNYIRYSVNVEDDEIRENAAFTVVKHLKYFLEKMPVSTPQKPVSVIQYLAAKNKNNHLDAGVPNLQEWGIIKTTLNNYSTQIMKQSADQDIFDRYISSLQNAAENYDAVLFKQILSEFEKWVNEDVINRANALPVVQVLKALSLSLTNAARISKICTQVKNLENLLETRYLSLVMLNCSIFMEDTPYAPLATLFQNPHEAPIVAKVGEKKEYLTAKEGIMYTLPGMWTHRLFNGQRVFINHRGISTLAPDFSLKLHLDQGPHCPELEYKGVLSKDEVEQISQILDVSVDTETTMHKLIAISAKMDWGIKGQPNSVFQGMPPYKGLLYDIKDSSRGDVSQGPAGMMLRPRAHSINWQLSKLSGDTQKSQTYKIANTSLASSTDKETLSVIKQPLLARLFSNIVYDSNLSVKRLALGVSRSNLVVLQNYHNEGKAVIVDNFVTNGFRFTIEPNMLEKVRTLATRHDHPFDERVIRMIGSWILKNDKFLVNSFLLEMFLDIMVNESFIQSNDRGQNAGEFPETISEFIDLLFGSGNPWDETNFAKRAEQDAITTDYTGDEALSLKELYKILLENSDYLKSNYQSMMADWYQDVFLNTLGLALSESVAQFAGVPSDAVSYTFNNAESEHECTIDVFDDDAEGNGSTELANKFFHMPVEVRELAQHFGDTNLPTSSLVDVIEDRLRMCEEHILHSISLSNKETSGIPRWMQKESDELREHFSEKRWNEMGIENTRLATLQNRRRFAYVDNDSPSYRTDLVNWDLALSLCDVDCPACNGDDFGNLFPPHLVIYTTCRAVLDEALGDWTESQGYLRKNEHRMQIQLTSGDDVDSASFIHIKGNEPGSLPIRQRFVKYPSPSIGLSWQRFMEVPEKVDKYVRQQEVL